MRKTQEICDDNTAQEISQRNNPVITTSFVRNAQAMRDIIERAPLLFWSKILESLQKNITDSLPSTLTEISAQITYDLHIPYVGYSNNAFSVHYLLYIVSYGTPCKTRFLMKFLQ